ncbi:MAG: secretin and TonB N-terminal domain-containing protein, partial [Bacteroidota bacterium]|nr:secretin and TonB N-terminal domain-containing protein [Bacteroidota bacterium]
MKKIREPWVSDSYALKKCLAMMKWSLFFFFLSIIQVLAVDSYSQQTRLTLKFNQASLESVLNEIENKSEFYFLYNQDFVNTKQNVDLDVKSAKIEDVLNSLLKNTDIKYTISDRQIVLTNADNVSGLNRMSGQQNKISGKVTDSTGAPLPGVSVVLKGTTTGTITNSDGGFLL